MKLSPSVASVVTELGARALAATWSWRVHASRATGSGSTPGARGWRPVHAPVDLDPAVYVTWHEHLLPLALLCRRQGVVALVSRHRDGEILARILRRLGYETARGSSTRGGGPGLRRMIRAGRAGKPLAFTPDGPRGPARRCKPGAVRAAAATGLPVVPLATAATRSRRLGSWDQFMIPGPGARIYVSRGRPLHMPEGSAPTAGHGGDADPGNWTRKVERALEAARRRAERAVGGGGAPP